MVDAPGTCHLVGCPDKGQHPPHEIGNWLEYLAKLGAELEDKATKTAEWLLSMTEPIANTAYPKIGAADSWAPYEGGPTIPQPKDQCLGFPVAKACELGDPTIHVRCSIDVDAWSKDVSNIEPNGWAALVDDHVANCPNRKVAPNGG